MGSDLQKICFLTNWARNTYFYRHEKANILLQIMQKILILSRFNEDCTLTTCFYYVFYYNPRFFIHASEVIHSFE